MDADAHLNQMVRQALQLDKAGRPAEARQTAESALHLARGGGGAGGVAEAFALVVLAQICCSQGDEKEASILLQRALPIHEKLMGPYHELTVQCRINLETVLRAVIDPSRVKRVEGLLSESESLRVAGKFDEAWRVAEEANNLSAGQPGMQALTARSHMALALLFPERLGRSGYIAMEQLREVQGHCERAVSLIEGLYGPDHQMTANARRFLSKPAALAKMYLEGVPVTESSGDPRQVEADLRWNVHGRPKRYPYPTGTIELTMRVSGGEAFPVVMEEVRRKWTPGNEHLWDEYDIETLLNTKEKRHWDVNPLLYSRLTIYRALRERGRDIRGKDPFLFASEVPEVLARLKAQFPPHVLQGLGGVKA